MRVAFNMLHISRCVNFDCYQRFDFILKYVKHADLKSVSVNNIFTLLQKKVL